MKIVDRITIGVELPGHGYTFLRYELIAPGKGKGWGLCCTLDSTGETAAAIDVTNDQAEAKRLLRMMSEGTVTPVSFYDILYDLLP